MSSLEVIRRLHQHRIWANGRLLAAAETLPQSDLQKSLEIGQGSIWRSLCHIHAAEWVWLATLEGNESPVLPGDLPTALPGNQQAEGGFTSLRELHEAWSALDARWIRYLEDLQESQLEDLVSKISSIAQKRMVCRRLDILLHVCTHAHYTVAQTVNMLRQVGAVSLPDTMLITMARQELAAPGT